MRNLETDANTKDQGQDSKATGAEVVAVVPRSQTAAVNDTVSEEILAETLLPKTMSPQEVDDFLVFACDLMATDEEAGMNTEHDLDLNNLYFPFKDDEVLANFPDFVAEVAKHTECGQIEGEAMESAETFFPEIRPHSVTHLKRWT